MFFRVVCTTFAERTMTKRLCFIWLVLFPIYMYGEISDSSLVKGIARASQMALHNQRDSAIDLADSLLSYAEQRKAMMAQASLHYIIATCYQDKKDNLTALKEFMTVMVIADQGDFVNKAATNPSIYELMIPTFMQTVVLTRDLGWMEQSASCAKTGVVWAMRCPQKDLVIMSMPVFGAVLTENKEYELVYEPLKQAYNYAIQQGNADHALGIVRSLVEVEEHLHHLPPNKNPWVLEGQRLMRHAKEDKVSLAFLTTTQASYVKEMERRDSDTINLSKSTIIATSDSTSTPSLSFRNDSIQHHTQYVFVRNKKAIKIGIIVIVLLLVIFGLYTLWQRYVRRKRETQRYIEGLEQERNRLAKELHDNVSNQLLAVEMKLNTEEDKEQAMKLLSESREQVRRVSHELMPPEFSYATLDEVISHYVLEINGANHCDISFHLNPLDADWSSISPQNALEIYRIVQEAVSNALKHSNATSISVGMHKTEHDTAITISDNGVSEKKAALSGIGIRTMEQRAQLIGATLEFITNKYGHVVKLTL